MKIEELKFSVRTYNCLKRKGYDTVEQIRSASDDDLLNIRGFGIGCLKEVRAKMGMCVDHIPQKTPIKIETVPVAEELEKAVRILEKEYEQAKKNPYIRNPIANALYHTWKQLDERR